MYKLLYCELPCTQANWEKKALALFTSLETGYAGYHVHFSYVAWIYKATLQAISENFAGTDTFCKIFHHIFCVPASSKNSAPLIFRYPRFQFDFSA